VSNALVKHVGRIGSSIWSFLPARIQERRLVRTLGDWIHTLSRKFGDRNQSISTWFLRNRPSLLTILDLINENFPSGGSLRLCVLGCSTGPELYSVLWTIRKARSDLQIFPLGIDISEPAIEKAKTGTYFLDEAELRGGIMHPLDVPVLSEDLLLELFERNGEGFEIKKWIAAEVQWKVADARDPKTISEFGFFDIVLANNFLIHMKERDAAQCLSDVAQLVKPGGLLICRGVDLGVREQVMRRLKLTPIRARIEEIHNADAAIDAQLDWPWKYWGLEPLDKTRRNWIWRYATVFRAPRAPGNDISFALVTPEAKPGIVRQ
jgi:chemotaxis methyl-accepting protein methylase